MIDLIVGKWEAEGSTLQERSWKTSVNNNLYGSDALRRSRWKPIIALNVRSLCQQGERGEWTATSLNTHVFASCSRKSLPKIAFAGSAQASMPQGSWSKGNGLSPLLCTVHHVPVGVGRHNS